MDAQAQAQAQAQTTSIAVDALGGDAAPEVVLKGVERALREDEALKVVLTGPANVIGPFAQLDPTRIEAVGTTQAIGMDEHPAQAVHAKKDSSIVVGCRLVKEGRAQAFFSAGSTGACMAAATLVIGRAKGVQRPAIATVVPSPKGPLVLVDVGANADVKPEYLVQFGQMGGVYAEKVLGISRPRIALLNIGAEEGKGSQLAQEAYALMREKLRGFAGNAEGTDIFAGRFDVIVTDGFTGNVTLKTLEGTAEALFGQVKAVLSSSTKTKIAAALVQKDLRALKDMMSADATGGAPLLGLRNVCIIGHGSSNEKAVANGIHVAAQAVRAGLAATIAREIEG